MCIGNNDNAKNHDFSRLLMIVPKRVIRNVRLGTENFEIRKKKDFRNRFYVILLEIEKSNIRCYSFLSKNTLS